MSDEAALWVCGATAFLMLAPVVVGALVVLAAGTALYWLVVRGCRMVSYLVAAEAVELDRISDDRQRALEDLAPVRQRTEQRLVDIACGRGSR